ncbi:MAG: Smr/MutS family protein [Porphyromonas sp.]|nr:Smr/MutS family protein [Porphyromonas sp.]
MSQGVYPHNYEQVLGFHTIREQLESLCENEVGENLVSNMSFMAGGRLLVQHLTQLKEMMWLDQEGYQIPSFAFAPLRESLLSIRPDGAYLSVESCVALRQMLHSAQASRQLLDTEESIEKSPEIRALIDEINDLPELRRRLHNLLDEEGNVKDTASSTLREIRNTLRQIENSQRSTMQRVLKQAQSAGYVPADAAPAMREGRLLLPIIPSAKREMPGIVHEQSNTGQTLYLEPMQLVELNNEIKEKQSEERREIIRLLREFTTIVRRNLKEVQRDCSLLGILDFIRAKSKLAKRMDAIVPEISDDHSMEWYAARHPLLERRLHEEGRKLVPLSVKLSRETRIILISGPNAGGKSVTLKTVGLLQYMLQCGLAVPMLSHSICTFFDQVLLNIGDQQSLDNDLSTYSSHLQAMKYFITHVTAESLVLIDEFGSGTEPAIGGAIATGVLEQFRLKGTYGIITTHYGNLKDYAEQHDALLNGAMLFDRGAMQPLYELYLGQPGSSFAIEIARKIGLPEEVLNYAEELVGTDYMLQDKYLQDIMRDKAYWNRKRQNIRKQEKTLEQKQTLLEEKLSSLTEKRAKMLREAEEEALKILTGANAAVERTIREIKNKEAEKEATQKARKKLKEKTAQLEKKQKKQRQRVNSQKPSNDKPIAVGDTVKLPDSNVVGEVLELQGEKAKVSMGNITMTLPIQQLQPTKRKSTETATRPSPTAAKIADERKLNFKPQLDCRGMRVDEALQAVTHFIDDAVYFGYSPVRILHGTGTGALKEAIAQSLRANRQVRSFKEEHVDFGGAGITVVEL